MTTPLQESSTDESSRDEGRAGDGLRHVVRRSIRAFIGACPAGTHEIVYKQLQGICRRLGASPTVELVTASNGVLMNLDLRDRTQRIIYYNSFETNLIPCLERHLKPGDRFVDVGANVGFYTTWAARHLRPHGSVISFEPVPNTFAVLQKNVRLNQLGNVALLNIALGASASCALVNVDPTDSGLSHFVTGSPGQGPVLEVPVTTLDEALLGGGERTISAPGAAGSAVDLLKVDAEGAELEILRGGEELLRRTNAPYLVLEVDPGMLQRRGASESALLQMLFQRGYSAFDIDRGGRLRPLLAGEQHGHNLFFAPAGRPAVL